jgi:hypothetical protein
MSSGFENYLITKFVLLEQIQLLIESLDRPLRGIALAAGAGNFVFLTQVGDKVRQALGVGGRKKRAILIAPTIVLGEMGKVLLKERKEYGRRARLQKKGVGENVVGAGIGGGSY